MGVSRASTGCPTGVGKPVDGKCSSTYCINSGVPTELHTYNQNIKSIHQKMPVLTH